jgi:Phosphotransferase enzyme family
VRAAIQNPFPVVRAIHAAEAKRDPYRLLLLRDDASEILVIGEEPPFALPCIEVPRWERVAENLNSAVREQFQLSTLCLFTLDWLAAPTGDDRLRYQVMEVTRPIIGTSNRTRWIPRGRMNSLVFSNQQDFLAFSHLTAKLAEFQVCDTVGAFARPGWIQDLWDWVQRAIAPHGLRLSGAFRQLNASPTFALLRLETSHDDQAVWFKAVGEPNLREFSITAALSHLLPEFLPAVLATHDAWHGWLMSEFHAPTLEEKLDADAWPLSSYTLANLQLASLEQTSALIGAGCRDLRISCLLTWVEPFIEMMSRLMEQQQKATPPAMSTREVKVLGRRIKEALCDLAELHIPDALGHLDFNPGNILCSRDRCLFLDWAEAYIGPPLFTFDYLRVHLERIRPDDSEITSSSMHRTYREVWSSVIPLSAIVEGQRLARLLAVFAYAAASEQWHEPETAYIPRTAAYYRSLTRLMQREASLL